ncbi:MAG: hypothetical protein ACLVFD_15410 [Anaerostipes hadrus]
MSGNQLEMRSDQTNAIILKAETAARQRKKFVEQSGLAAGASRKIFGDVATVVIH